MSKWIPNLLLISVLLIVALACVAPSATIPDPNIINTAIAQTYSAALIQTAQFGIPITGQESLTPTMTKFPSPTPFPTFTLVVFGVPQLRVSVDTNCRTGPGEGYDRVGVLRAGEVAEVVGRSADGNYWVIRNPDRVGETCWISGENASLTGIPAILPVVALPPTPTPTRTSVPASTPTRTSLPTFTPSRTPTRTPTPSFTPTSSTLTSTATITPTLSVTPTSSLTLIPTLSLTLTSSTPTTSPTITPTLSVTPTSSLTLIPTLSLTPTLTSSTPTTSPTITPTSSSTPTLAISLTPTPTSSFTPTSSSTSTFTPSPTSTLTPSFTAAYSGMESCTGTGWWVEVQLNNTGGTSFESIIVVLIDTVNGTVLQLRSDAFTNRDGCSVSNTQANLPPSSTHIVSLPVFAYDPTGHNLQATISLCSNDGQSGICRAQIIDFTP